MVFTRRLDNMKNLPLEELSIKDLFYSAQKNTFEIPIYQRNYAWEKDQVNALVNDVNDACTQDNMQPYYIGTLVSYNKGDNVFEIIDGQQRLTTIWLILTAMDEVPKNTLTYRARKKSTSTLKLISQKQEQLKDKSAYEKDLGIESGYKFAKTALSNIANLEKFKKYFLDKVRIIHYQVPKDIDLNHYFEVMNSRGEQLEKHEIVKAKLMSKLSQEQDRKIFGEIWDACAQMSSYLQKKIPEKFSSEIFTNDLSFFKLENYENLRVLENSISDNNNITINSIIDGSLIDSNKENGDYDNYADFQKLIDFPNFLFIVLKLYNIENKQEGYTNLNDKDLISAFEKSFSNESASPYEIESNIKEFIFKLLKAKFLLDTFIVHHANEDDNKLNNPCKLQKYFYRAKTNDSKAQTYPKNLCSDDANDLTQLYLVQLLSMFEVTYTPYQRKNYLLYCLQFLFNEYKEDRVSSNNVDAYIKELTTKYKDFLNNLADNYFFGIYIQGKNFDEAAGSLRDSKKEDNFDVIDNIRKFDSKYVNGVCNSIEAESGKEIKKEIPPLFVFNYLDYKIWKLYAETIRGKNLKKGTPELNNFFYKLGCSDLEIDIFKSFYFSRTRNSLEHYSPQALASKDTNPDDTQINCLGNYAMIGREANSSGSDWNPKTKNDHYLNNEKKINPVSVSSLKFLVMMKICSEHNEWAWNEIQEHQKKMLMILFDIDENDLTQYLQ